MIRTYFFCLLFFPGLICTAQLPLHEVNVDSLNRVAFSPGSDSLRARVHFILMSYWTPRDTVKARQHLNAAWSLGKRYPYLKALYYSGEGFFYYTTDINKSEACYRKADSMLAPLHDKQAYQARSETIFRYAVIQQRKDNDEAYIDLLLNKAIPLAEQSGDSAMLAVQLQGVGIGFMNIEQYDKAETYIDQAIALLRSKKPVDTARLISAYNRAGDNLFQLKKFDKLKNALDSSGRLLAAFPQSELNAGYNLLAGLYAHHLGQYKAAISSFDKAILAAGGPNKPYVIQEIQFAKIKSLIADKQYTSARQLLDGLLNNEDAMSFAGDRLTIYQGMYQCYEGLGQKSTAYDWLLKYSVLNDSLLQSKTIEKMRKMEMQFQTAEKEKKILSLQSEKNKALLTAQNRRTGNWLLAALSLLLMLALASGFLFYKNRKRTTAQHEKTKLAQAMLATQEEERGRIARDLHDGLGNTLAGIKLDLALLAGEQADNSTRYALDKLTGQLGSSIEELRQIAHHMMPGMLLRLGLKDALKDLCRTLETAGINVRYEYTSTGNEIPLQKQLILYRIVQELFTNIIKHAGAHHVHLQCAQQSGIFLLTVEDDGTGLYNTDTKKSGGAGLKNIESRIGYLEGSIDIVSQRGVPGTSINIQVNVTG